MNRIKNILEIKEESEKVVNLVKYCEVLKAKCRMVDSVMDLNQKLQDFNDKLLERVEYLEHENTKLYDALLQRELDNVGEDNNGNE
jgi:hypothetical protein